MFSYTPSDKVSVQEPVSLSFSPRVAVLNSLPDGRAEAVGSAGGEDGGGSDEWRPNSKSRVPGSGRTQGFPGPQYQDGVGRQQSGHHPGPGEFLVFRIIFV